MLVRLDPVVPTLVVPFKDIKSDVKQPAEDEQEKIPLPPLARVAVCPASALRAIDVVELMVDAVIDIFPIYPASIMSVPWQTPASLQMPLEPLGGVEISTALLTPSAARMVMAARLTATPVKSSNRRQRFHPERRSA